MISRQASEKRYRRCLPHIRNAGRTYHVRFSVLAARHTLDQEWKFAIVEEALLFRHKKQCLNHGYIVMPDHVHVVLQPLPIEGGNVMATRLDQYHNLEDIVAGMKKHTSLEINRRSGDSGRLWETEYFDRIVRGEKDLEELIDYIHHNPVRWGLVDKPEDYRWSSLRTIYSGDQAFANWFDLSKKR